MAMIKDRLLHIQENIAKVCAGIKRNPADIILVGVTKFANVEGIQEALKCGLIHIAENKVQEAQKKFLALNISEREVTKHMIGHLQTNKVKAALKIFDMIQSVDSLNLAKEIDREAQKLNKAVDILIQVNTSEEKQKFGVEKGETLKLIEDIIPYEHLRILGLMTMAPYQGDPKMIRQCFRDLKVIKEKVFQQFQNHPQVQMQYLSMGMTDDYEIAIEEGANMLRIGRAIFGKDTD